MRCYNTLIICLYALFPFNIPHVFGESTVSEENELKNNGKSNNGEGEYQAQQDLSWRPWEKENYPNPEINSFACRTSSSRLCDPDGILIDIERRKIIEKINWIEEKYNVNCDGKANPIQLTVAIANKINLNPYKHMNDSEEKAVKDFSVYLHNKWGVGVDTKCGGTGMVFFISILDKALYFSRGDGLADVLTDKRIDRLIESITSHLKQQYYSSALQDIVDGVSQYFEGGPPNKEELWMDRLETLIPISIMVLVFGVAIFKGIRDEREARSYATVQTQLSQLDRDRALVLQGQYQCSTCPICLEPFKKEEGETLFTHGSDGLPLKLLRCGHAFDETCWSEWVTNGSGNLRRCPICQQDVGAGGNETAPNNNNNILQQQQATEGQNQDRVIRHFNRERNFRIARLALQFPRYVNRAQIQRWTSPTYDGTLARDPTFIRNNPRYNNNNNSSGGKSYGNRSFGGGSSGGGRGGRW